MMMTFVARDRIVMKAELVCKLDVLPTHRRRLYVLNHPVTPSQYLHDLVMYAVYLADLPLTKAAGYFSAFCRHRVVQLPSWLPVTKRY